MAVPGTFLEPQYLTPKKSLVDIFKLNIDILHQSRTGVEQPDRLFVGLFDLEKLITTAGFHCYFIVFVCRCPAVPQIERYPFPLGTSDNLGLFPHLNTHLTVLENTNTVVVDRHKPRVFCFYKHRQNK